MRVAAFATAARDALLPVARTPQAGYPAVRLHIFEHEPTEALTLMCDDRADLALTYDYNPAPAALDPTLVAAPLWHARWSLAVPTGAPHPVGDALSSFRGFLQHDWVVNSRESADEQVIPTVASMAGFTPRIGHRADSLDLVQDIITAGLAVGLLPAPDRPGRHPAPAGRPRGRPAGIRREPPRAPALGPSPRPRPAATHPGLTSELPAGSLLVGERARRRDIGNAPLLWGLIAIRWFL
ncbi:MAG: hypothetical protein HHJ11_05585 [Phycicoccus sp.]|nr:hypothetical protein [Phycicoccus sp.]